MLTRRNSYYVRVHLLTIAIEILLFTTFLSFTHALFGDAMVGNVMAIGVPFIVGAFLFGIVAVVGIQFLFVGSAYPWLNCSAFADVTGALLIGLAPLMLAYLIVAALASLMASAPEK